MKTLFRIFNVMFFSAALVFAVVSMTFAASLPDGLTELQYIEVGKKTAYIDTGVTINKSKMPGKYRQVLRASWVLSGTNGKQYCGASNVFSLGVDGSTTQANIIVSNGIRGPGIQSGTPYTIDATYDIKKGQVSFSVDGGTEYTGSLLSSFTDGASFTVFADSGKNSVFLPGSRVYSYQLYVDDDLVVDLVPVQITGTDVVGMYDTVSRGLFERMGDGSFVPGPEVVDTSISQVCTDMIKNAGLGTYYYDEVNSSQGKFTVAAVMQTVPNASSLLESVPETCTLKCQDPTLTFDFGALNSCMRGDASACSGICVDFVSTNGPCRNNGEKYNYKGDCVMTTYQDSGIDLGSWAGFVDKTFGIPAGYVDASDYPHACPKLDNVMSDAGRCVCKDGGWFDTTTGTCLSSFVIDFDDKTSMTVSLKNAPTTVASSSMGLFDTFGHVVFDSNGKYAYGISGDTNSYISTDVGNPGHVFASAGKSASSVSVVKIELLDGKGTVSQNIYYVPKGSDGNYYFTDEKLGKPLTGAVITGIPTITGYTFGGYFSQKNAGGTKYVDAKGAFASNWWDGSSLTVQMQPFYTANTITLDLSPEGSTVKTTTCTYDSSFVLPTPTERSGYTFNGWLMPDGKTYAAGTSVTCNNALLGTDDGTTKSIGASWTPKSAPAGSCPGSFFDYENKEWIQDYTCEDVGQNLIGEGFDHNVLTDGCSCMCDPFDAAFNPVAANACMKGETDACAEVCIPLDQPCDYGQRPYVVDGIAQCGYYFDPEFGLIDYYGSQRWGEFLDGNGMSAGYMSPTGELLPCYGDGVKESEDGTGRCVCTDGGWFLMDEGRCTQELPVDLMLDPEGTQNYANVMLDFLHNPFNLVNEGYGLPDGGAGLTLDQIMDMVNGQGTQMFDNNGEWTYTPMGTETQYIYKSIPLVGYPVYSGTPAPVVVKVNLDFQGGNSSWSEFYYVYGRTTPGPFFNSSSVQTPIYNSVINKPTRTGYTFGGYYTSTNGNGQQYVDENGVINDNLVYYTSTTPLTLYAKWTPNTYTISYNLNSGTHGASHPTSATYDTSFTVSNPTRSGYTFSGWKITGMDSVTHTYGNSTTASNSISSTTATTFKNLRSTSGTVTFTAQWTQNIPTCYQIHFDNATNGGSGGTTDIWLYRNSSNLSDSKNCKIYSDSACTNVITSITPPTKLNGFYIGQYSVTGVNAESPYNEGWFDTEGGSHIAEDRNYCNNTTNTSGYFNDLDYTYGFQGNQSPAITLRALFECTPGYYNNSDNRCLANTVVLDWQESGGNSIPDGSCTYGGNLVLPSAPSRSGYTFTGWRLADGTMANAGTTITGGCVVGYTNAYNGTSAAITAQWSQGTYTVSFNANGGTGGQSANVSATYGSAMPTISTTAPTRTGYTFDGWYDSVSLPSGYKKLEYIAKNNASQYIQTDYVGNLNSRYEGAVLLTNNTDAYDIASRVNASGNTRNIAFACSGSTSYIGYGTYTSAATNRHQCVLNDRMDFVTDYLNRQWSVSIGNSTSTKQMSSDAITSFTNTAPLQIFFNRVAGATSTASYAAPIGTRIYYLKIYENNNLVHHFVPAKRNSDNAIGVYDVVENEFLTNAIANTGSFTAGPETNLEVKYYNANGTSAKNWDKTANTTLYAHWTANAYTVSFNANGGTGGQTADVTATYGAAMPTLGANSAPTRTGYYLVGWYDNSDYTASGATQYYNWDGTSMHNWDKTANTTLYAGWDGIKYMITLDDEANGGTSGSGSVIQKYASRWTTSDSAQTTITSVNIPKRTNSIFNGYYSAITNGTQHIPATGVLPSNTTFTDDTTLYAQFSDCKCSAGTGVDTCTTSSTTSNTCTATATCKVGYEEPVASCTGANCTSSCTPQKYTISIKPNGGKINDSVNNFEFYELYNTEFRDLTDTNVLTDIPVAVRDGYSLTGYFTASTGGTLKIGSDGLLPVPSTFMGDTTLYAQWAQDVITCTAGNYLPANSTTCATCPAGYYCPNTGNYVQSSSNQGIVSCASGKITETAGATSASQCKSPEFSMTTTSLAAGTVFSFTMSAKGNFVIDWGDGNIQQITRTNTTNTTYSHTYTTAGTYTIGMLGQATGYNSDTSTAAIGFMNNTKIAGISGSLGAIFGTLSSGTNNQPRFYKTFNGCSKLTGSIPENLFAGVSGAPVDGMFAYTFYGCRGLTGSIPAGLFSGISGSNSSLFSHTFDGCSGLTGSIPAGLFSGISGAPRSNMFYYTFNGCSGLTGFVPQDLFAGITNTSYASGPMANVFNGTGLATACPAGYYQYITGFEADFSSKVACTPCPTGYTSGVGKTAISQCYLVVDGGHVRDGTSGTTLSTCAAGTYKTSHNEYYGTSYSCDTCPTTNPYSPAGAADAGACGRKLHIGDNVMYLRSTQKTTPSLKFDFNKDGVADLFGNMSTSSKKMSSGVDKSFKVNYGGQVYYIHDDTVQ